MSDMDRIQNILKYGWVIFEDVNGQYQGTTTDPAALMGYDICPSTFIGPYPTLSELIDNIELYEVGLSLQEA